MIKFNNLENLYNNWYYEDFLDNSPDARMPQHYNIGNKEYDKFVNSKKGWNNNYNRMSQRDKEEAYFPIEKN